MRRKSDLVMAVAVPLASLSIVAFIYQLWDYPLGIPFNYTGDALVNGMVFKEIADCGWFFTEDRLGAPFAQHHQDWPQPNVSTHVAVKLLSMFTQNWAAMMNVVYLVGFPLIALSSWWVLRKLNVERWIAGALGIAYAFLPFHLLREQSHIYLANYAVIPLALWLCIEVLSGHALLKRHTRSFGSFNWHNTRTIAIAVFLAAQDPYYGFLGAALLLFATIANAFVDRRWNETAKNTAVVALILSVIVACSTPALLYYRKHGPNPLNAVRHAGETEAFALKWIHLLLPPQGHRIDALGDFSNWYYRSFPLPSEGTSASLGILGALGVLVLSTLVFARLIKPAAIHDASLRHLTSLAAFAFLFATVGGLATITAFITPMFRSVNRMSLFLGFAALAAIGIILTRVVNHRQLPRSIPLAPFIAAILVFVAIFDQVTPAMGFGGLPNQPVDIDGNPIATSRSSRSETTRTLYLQDQQFFRNVERTIGPDRMIYVLPPVEFLDTSSDSRLREMQPMAAFLHTTTTRWSYGGQEGRLEYLWQQRLSPTNEPDAFLFDVVAAGFDGLLVERRGYEDRASSLIEQITSMTHVTPVRDTADTRSFFDLRNYAATLRSTEPSKVEDRRSHLLFPATLQTSPHVRNVEIIDGIPTQWIERNTVALSIENTSTTTQHMTVSFSLDSYRSTGATGRVTWPDHHSDTIVFSDNAPIRQERSFDVKPGLSKITISTDAHCTPEGDSHRCLRLTDVRSGKAANSTS